jgi:hypothetical protein
MTKSRFPFLVLPGFAAILAAGAGLVHAASVDVQPAYGAIATQLEAATAAATAKSVFSRADLDNDGSLSRDEFLTLAVVSAELARLNGFVPVDYAGGVRTVALPYSSAWSSAELARIETTAERDYALFAGVDERMSAGEFVTMRLESLTAADIDRNGVLTGSELGRFAAIEARLPSRQS